MQQLETPNSLYREIKQNYNEALIILQELKQKKEVAVE